MASESVRTPHTRTSSRRTSRHRPVPGRRRPAHPGIRERQGEAHRPAGGRKAGRHPPGRHKGPGPQREAEALWRGMAGRRAGTLATNDRLKAVSEIRYGLGQPPRESDTGLPLIRATNVSRGHIAEKDLLRVDPADVPVGRDAFLREKEIIVVRSGAYTADSAIITEGIHRFSHRVRHGGKRDWSDPGIHSSCIALQVPQG